VCAVLNGHIETSTREERCGERLGGDADATDLVTRADQFLAGLTSMSLQFAGEGLGEDG
jgi:hypothetical protein